LEQRHSRIQVPLQSLCFISPCIYLHSDSGCTIGGYFFYYYLIAFDYQMRRNLYVTMLSVCEYTESEYIHRNIITFFFFAIKCGNKRKSRHDTFGHILKQLNSTIYRDLFIKPLFFRFNTAEYESQLSGFKVVETITRDDAHSQSTDLLFLESFQQFCVVVPVVIVKVCAIFLFVFL
jgi:hypothetical protein